MRKVQRRLWVIGWEKWNQAPCSRAGPGRGVR